MIKRFLLAIIFVGVVVGGIVGFNLFRDQAIQDFFATRQAPAFPVDTVIAEAGTWQPGIEAIGTVFAARGINLAVEATGVVREVNFQANDDVSEGDLLVQIDDTIERAEVVAAQAQVDVSMQALERAQTLSSRGVGAAATVQEAEAAASSARAQIERLRAVLSLKALEAPFSGTIGLPRVEVGQYVSVGTAVATLQALDTLRVDFTVPEQQFGALSIGQTVHIATEAGGDVSSGTITGIEPRIDPQTRLVSVRAEVANQEGALNPGQFVRVRVELPAEEDVIALPQTAVTTSLYGDFVYVVVEPDDAEESAEGEPERLEARQIFVQTGRRNGMRVELTQGVNPGDRVVIAGQNRLSNGAAVTLSSAANDEAATESAEIDQ